jgi:hypothetical protein
MNTRIKPSSFKLLLTLLVTLSLPLVLASDDSIAPEEFLGRVFAGNLPASNTVWISGDKKEIVESILGHRPDFLRVRYWGDRDRSAWIVDEIGKTEPITIGIVVTGKQIEEVKVGD